MPTRHCFVVHQAAAALATIIASADYKCHLANVSAALLLLLPVCLCAFHHDHLLLLCTFACFCLNLRLPLPSPFLLLIPHLAPTAQYAFECLSFIHSLLFTVLCVHTVDHCFCCSDLLRNSHSSVVNSLSLLLSQHSPTVTLSSLSSSPPLLLFSFLGSLPPSSSTPQYVRRTSLTASVFVCLCKCCGSAQSFLHLLCFLFLSVVASVLTDLWWYSLTQSVSGDENLDHCCASCRQ